MNISHIIKITISLILLSTLFACSSSDNNKAAETSKTTSEIPADLQKLTLPVGSTLRAFVTIDGDAANRVEMAIDGSGAGSASASIPGLSKSVHTILISYEYTDGTGTITLATASNTVDLTSGSASMDFAATDYDQASYDDDSDGISNAAELAAGTDPRDSICVIGTSTIGNCTLG